MGFACEGAVPAYHVVHVGAVYEIIVDHILHFAPPRHLLAGRIIDRLVCAQSAVCHATVRFPFDFDRDTLSFLKFHGEFVAVRIPRCAPAAVYHFLVVDIDCLVAGVVHNKIVFSAYRRLQLAFVAYLGSGVVEIARKVHHVAEVAANKVLKVYFGFFAHYCFAVGSYVCACEIAGLAVFIV